jgi:hypothetical protein
MEGAELPNDKRLLQSCKNRLYGGGFQQPGLLPIPNQTSSKAGLGLNWLVIAISTASGSTWL